MEKLKIDDFTKYKFLSNVKISPDGKNVCFVVKESDLDENKYKSNLWLYRINEDKYFQLTSFDEESQFIWDDDNETILFSGTRNKKDKKKLEEGEEFTQFYKININGGEALPCFRIPRIVNSIKQIDDDTYVFTSIYDFNKPDLDAIEDEKEKEEAKKKIKEEKDYQIIDEIPFWANGTGYINKKRNRLYLYKVKEGKTEDLTETFPKNLTSKYISVGTININKDRTKLSFSADQYKDKMEMTNDIYIYELDNRKLIKITPYKDFGYDSPYFIEPDKLIFLGSDMKKYGINENSKHYIYDLKTNECKCITPDFDQSSINMVGTDCRLGTSYGGYKAEDGYFYYISTAVDSSYLFRLDSKGNIEKISENKSGSVDSFDVIGDKLFYIAMRKTKLQEIYRLNGNTEKQITDLNGFVNKEMKLSEPEKHTIETDKGVNIDGWIIKPVDFDPNKKYPAILDIHGGPKTVYGEIFYNEMQYWANEGYVVFFCNPRGSDGKGNEFADIRGKYGTIDYEDIMKFTDYVLEKFSFIDKDRVGVTGGSYGGFMTNWIIGHTNRFKSVVSQRSISNWVSKFGITDIGYYFNKDQTGATPWEDVEKMWTQSPLKYADKVKTPTLFIHSEQDYRCWIDNAYQMFTALKLYGVESKICVFKGENHELSRGGKPKHRIRRLKEIKEWFDKYLK